MKKNIIILVISISIISCFIYLNYFYSSIDISDNICRDAYKRNKDNVDRGVKECLELDQFKSLDENEQIDCMFNLLKKYEDTSKIKNLKYDENAKLFSFKNKNGYLGGVRLKDFDPYLN